MCGIPTPCHYSLVWGKHLTGPRIKHLVPFSLTGVGESVQPATSTPTAPKAHSINVFTQQTVPVIYLIQYLTTVYNASCEAYPTARAFLHWQQ